MRKTVFVLSVIALLSFAAPVAAQKVDPLTGQVVEEAPPPEPEFADLTEANALVRAQDYLGAETLLATLQNDFPEDIPLLALRGEL
ncbi:MAG: hypothetical protein GTN89_16315, partial [Acidobacteria bacterium]|nr:hypothetical protein [Acidobacteriota bacterium]NIM63080.1 hypothetical protein [Acidobacteriota bacterium]NIO60791.1 hypothetical protein [Acidobacteriota bacterium]NIQ31863.1 hypothetical protein [Acidobacteriota bacterium]NIQ87240.1 hypothetical protein [Acidobacteriota bacterium]